MGKYKLPIAQALKEGRSYELEVPEDGDLASMRAILKHGQVLTLSPIVDPQQIRLNDIVFVEWLQGNYILHLVKEIQGDQFLISNSVGKLNGWVPGSKILGRVTQITEPQPRPSVPDALILLQDAYRKIVANQPLAETEVQRLCSLVDDLIWYASRIGPERWERWPKPNKMSFKWHLWHITEQMLEAADAAPYPICTLIDHGKEHIGEVAQIAGSFESPRSAPTLRASG